MRMIFEGEGEKRVTLELEPGDEKTAAELARDFLGVKAKPRPKRKRAEVKPPLNTRQLEDLAVLAGANPLEGMSAAEFAEERGIGKGTASFRLSQLANLKAIKRVYRGRYAL